MSGGDLRRKRITGPIVYSLPVRAAAHVACFIGLLLSLLSASRAEQLPIKRYTTADGLVRNQISRIVRDSFGFLWFCTQDGLSRFDGYSFSNYTTDNGLPSHGINDLLETRSGVYWVATDKGVSRFSLANPDNRIATAQLLTAEPKFVTYYPGQEEATWHVNVLLEDHTGAIWCGTARGVFRLEQSGDQMSFRFVDLGMPKKTADDASVEALREDRQGALWVATRGSGLYRYLPDGRAENYTTRNGLPTNDIRSLLEDREGRLWVGTLGGLCLLVPQPNANARIVARVFNEKDGLPGYVITSLFQSAEGVLWVGVFGGLSRLITNPVSSPINSPNLGKGAAAFRSYTKAQGVDDYGIWAVAQDLDGNLWLGTDSSGAIKIARSGFTTFSEADGLGSSRIPSIFENRKGELCVVGSSPYAGWTINQFDGKSFTAIRPNVPKNIIYFGWGWNQIALQDRMGEWWVPTGFGLYRFPKVSDVAQLAHARPKAVYTTKDGLPTDDIFRLYEDSRGDIWIATISNSVNGLTRWERATETFHNFAEEDDYPKGSLPTAFSEDASRNLWIGFSGAGLTRYTDGRFKLFKQTDGVPGGWIRAIFADHAGRLWIAAGQGLSRIDDPSSDQPHFHTLTTADGLSSSSVWCVTEDKWGHIYVGTGRGLDRLDPATGHIRHYTSADGLGRGDVQEAFRDAHGALWFAAGLGLSRLIPEPDPPRSPPPILITGLRVAGIARSVGASGESLVLGPNENQVQIDFVGLEFGAGESLRYQYKLEGSQADWSAPTGGRSVNFASLSPGEYRFSVRAISTDGDMSVTPAMVSFTILPPIWRRWWFVMLAAVALGLAVYTGHRYRVAQLVALERVRTRIASDLHDDIGANLTKIAILTEAEQQRSGAQRLAGALPSIARISRESVASMSDIVWAINPKRDSLLDLTRRMRRFAADAFTARDIAFSFRAPGAEQNIKLGADIRRQVYLIFKESVNNIVRHSACTNAAIDFRLDGASFILHIKDNGRGFDPNQENEGQGLVSMRRRAQSFNGALEIISGSDGAGTTIMVTIPAPRRGWFSRNKAG
jgi:ligand-binding sensor domain-containing protein/two-component sensor histidine kinase